MHYNIGKNAADKGHRDLAISEYQMALQLHRDYDQAMNNLANLLKDAGQLSDAEKLLLKAVQVRPDFAAAWMNLGIVEALLDKYEQAEASYLTALTHRKYYPDAYYNLGNLVNIRDWSCLPCIPLRITSTTYSMIAVIIKFGILFQYLQLKIWDDAYDAFRNATTLQPRHVLAWTNLIVMLENIGKST